MLLSSWSFCAATAAEPVLAPTGTLRAAYIVANLAQAQRDPVTGEVSGVIVDITRELGRRAALLDRPDFAIGVNTDDSVGVWLREHLTAAQVRATQAIAVPLERSDRLKWVNAVLDELRASGFLADSVARSGVDGLEIAPAGRFRPTTGQITLPDTSHSSSGYDEGLAVRAAPASNALPWWATTMVSAVLAPALLEGASARAV